MFIVYASTLSSAIGVNPFQSPLECFEYHNGACNKPEIYNAKLKNGQTLGTLVESKVKENVSKTSNNDFLEEIKETIMENLPDNYKTDENIKEALAIPQKVMGVEREKNIADKLNINKNNKPISKTIYTRNGSVYLVGRLDGKKIIDGVIVEIKNRTRHLYRHIFPSEMCQLYAYMFLTGSKEIIHMECYDGEINETLVTWDDKYWEGILEGLEKYTETFLKV